MFYILDWHFIKAYLVCRISGILGKYAFYFFIIYGVYTMKQTRKQPAQNEMNLLFEFQAETKALVKRINHPYYGGALYD